MSTETPVFVVVGNVNQGKSSVVAALSENETIPIDSYPGTTVRSGSYVFRVGAQARFRIVDTPGFQQARRALAWLRARTDNPGERRQAVADFVAEHRDSGEFPDEVELLQPILEGAGVLYVVDASSRFQPANEAEMEILRWTGQPAMALVNRIRERDHAAEWRPILEQFFNIVREFDAHGASFEARVRLLRGFAELREDWRAPVENALAAMSAEWEERRRRAAAVVADALVEGLSHVERCRVDAGGDEQAAAVGLEAAYRDSQRRIEDAARSEVESIYRHGDMESSATVLEILGEDLFSEASWRLFGLTRPQLARYGAAWGAVIGVGVDLMVGGFTFFAGAGIGAGVGALAGWFGGERAARTWNSRSRMAQLLFPEDTGRFVAIGPVTSPRYAWLLADRALTHLSAIRDRSHARRDALHIGEGDGPQGVASRLDADVRGGLDSALRQVTKEALRGGVSAGARDRLRRAVEQAVEATAGSARG